MQVARRKYRRSNEVINHWSLVLSCSIVCHSVFAGLLLLSPVAFSQAINTSPSDVALPEPVFYKAYIKQNKIKIVRAGIVDKPDGEIIRDKGLAENFLFDEEGNLVRHYYNEITSLEKTEIEIPAVYSKKGRVIKKSSTKINYEYRYDTLGTEYVYTSNGYLRMKRVCIGDFFQTTYYEYFGEGLVSRQTLCKETNIAKKGEPFKLGVQTVLSDEKFEYEQLTSTQVKKKFLNDEGKPYKQGIINFSSQKPIDESYEFIVGFIRSGITYKYDSNGRLADKITSDNSSGNNTDKVSF